MTAFLDTSVVVRYLAGTPPDQARFAARVIDGAEQLYVTDVVIAEAAHVLRTFYQVHRDAIVDQLIAFVRKENVSLRALDKSLVIQALDLCRGSGRVSISDALVWAAARSEPSPVIYTLGQRFPAESVEIRLS